MSKQQQTALVPAHQQLATALVDRRDKIEGVLPDFMKGQGERLIIRAQNYWNRNPDLQKCTMASVVKCVIEAAELGFAIDGKLVYAVKFSTRVKGQKDQWEDIAQIILDYKAVIAVAKRHGLVEDCWATIIMPTDHFKFYERNGRVQYEYEPDLTVGRDVPDGARGIFAVARHAKGWIRCTYLPWQDVLKIRDRSKGYDPNKPCPWVTSLGEMSKKTGIKRLLKTFSDDPGLLRAMEIDDAGESQEFLPEAPKAVPSRASMVIPPPAAPKALAVEETTASSEPEHPDPEPEPIQGPQKPVQTGKLSPDLQADIDRANAAAAQAKAQVEAPAPAAPDASADIIEGWKFDLEACETPGACSQLRRTKLPKVPAALQPAVRKMIRDRQEALEGGGPE